LAAVANGFATDRRAHLAALRAELRRVRPSTAPNTSALPPTPVAVAGSSQAQDTLTAAAQQAQNEAAGLVPKLAGYRAALLASIAACCASHAAVLS
jgi:hypothetical protein